MLTNEEILNSIDKMFADEINELKGRQKNVVDLQVRDSIQERIDQTEFMQMKYVPAIEKLLKENV